MRDAALQGLAVGFFDGVHLGHQAILKGADAALTFRNHPLAVLAPEKAPRLIMSVEERVAAIKACGVDEVKVLEFTPELAEMSAEEFARRYLQGKRVLCGENWRFGKGGEGSTEFLRGMGMEVTVAPYVEYKGERLSSSRIRRCLENGEIEDANAMLGRRFQVSGSTFQGKGLGGKIGYPTVNLQLSTSTSSLHLPFGVYEVEVEGRRAIANYGLAPTMGDKAWREPAMEIHFLHCPPPPLSSTSVNVGFLGFIRKEMKFDSVEDLKRQIAADCARITA